MFDPGGVPLDSRDTGAANKDGASDAVEDATDDVDSADDDVQRDVPCVDDDMWYPDFDGDGFGDATADGRVGCRPDAGWVLEAGDCNDDDATVFPGATEAIGDGVDSDCDGKEFCFVDLDGDGFHQGVNTASDNIACDGPFEVGADASGGDCDEADRHTYPGAPELCDDVDNNCNDVVDENVEDLIWYRDADGDRYGDPSDSIETCEIRPGYELNSDDCDDADPARNPAAAELCDELDHNCDGDLDFGAVDASTWYRDADGDGFGLEANAVSACEIPDGYVAITGDCDDDDVTTGPGMPETCDGADNSCDGVVDEGCDDDDDGYCDEAMAYSGTPVVCPRGPGDCDDDDASFNPSASEVCDGWDNDCNGLTDDDASDAITWYYDGDGDGYGIDTAQTLTQCAEPALFAQRVGDCDDGDPTRNPGAAEQCNRIDDDCDGQIDEADTCPPEDCANGVDDDLDYYTDCGDSDCWASASCQESVVLVASGPLTASKTGVFAPSGNRINSNSTCGGDTRDAVAHPAGAMIYEACKGDNKIKLRTVPGLDKVGEINGLNSVRSLELHPSGAWLFATGKEDVYWIDTELDAVGGVIPFTDNDSGYGMDVSPDGTELAVGKDGSVLLVDIADIDLWSVTAEIPIDGIAYDVSHRGGVVVTWSADADEFTVIDTTTASVSAIYPVPGDGFVPAVNDYNLIVRSEIDGLEYAFTGGSFEIIRFDPDTLSHTVLPTPELRPAALLPSVDHSHMLIGPRAIRDDFLDLDVATGTTTGIHFETGNFNSLHDIVALIRVFHP